jgi:hypothetical protein
VTIRHLLASSPELAKVALCGAAEILAASLTPPAWAWQGVANEGGITMLAGPPSGGKTTLACCLLLLRASIEGGMLLGRYVRPMRPGRIAVLIEAEHSGPSISRKLVRTCRLLGLPESTLDRIVIVARKGVEYGDLRWAELEALVKLGIVSDAMLDTLARVAPLDANDEKVQTMLFSALGALLEASLPEAAIWLVAHTRKPHKSDDEPTIADVSGATARTGQCDSVALVLSNKLDGKSVSSTIHWPKIREAEDHVAPVTYAISRGKIEIIKAAPREPKSKAQAQPHDSKDLEAAILAADREQPGLSANKLAKEIGGRHETVMAVIGTLRTEGRISRFRPAGTIGDTDTREG